jgi:formate C-acetyltransferase
MLVKYFAAMARRTRVGLPALYRILRGRGLGVKTGGPEDFKSIDDVIYAYQAQVDYFAERMARAMDCMGKAHAELKPTPFISSTVDDCLERGMDVTWGGARYNYTGPQAVGLADVADSLAAIKTLVFDQGRVSMSELIEAMDRNFLGAEPLRQMLVNKAPKYGNHDPDADGLAARAAEIYCRQIARRKNGRGGVFRPGIYSISSHLVLGFFTGATPDGRKNGDPLAAGVSPKNGSEKKGPTAVLSSAASLDNSLPTNGTVLNMRYDPALLAGEENLKKFIDLVRAYFKMGGFQVQNNIVSAEILKEARDFPGRHPGLVVRVAGYSALFTELDRATQNDIIQRTAHGCEAP